MSAHDAVVQTKGEKSEADAVQACHRTISLLKRWLLGTHAGAVRVKYLQVRRRNDGVGRIAARILESVATKAPLTMRRLIDHTRSYHLFQSTAIA